MGSKGSKALTKCPPPIETRDVAPALRLLRDFLLGHKYVLHNRFPQNISPRSIPQPDLPNRGCDIRYHNMFYCNRHAMNSVKPAVVFHLDKMKLPQKPGGVDPRCPPPRPTPGDNWWWDGHCYYECMTEEDRYQK